MSAELAKKINDIGAWVIKGIIAITCWFAAYAFNGVKESVVAIEKKFEKVSDNVVDIKENLSGLHEKVNGHEKELDRLDRQKQDKK